MSEKELPPIITSPSLVVFRGRIERILVEMANAKGAVDESISKTSSQLLELFFDEMRYRYGMKF